MTKSGDFPAIGTCPPLDSGIAVSIEFVLAVANTRGGFTQCALGKDVPTQPQSL